MNHNMMLNRQSYLDYTSYSNSNKQEPKNNPPPKEVYIFLYSRKKTLILKEVYKTQILIQTLKLMMPTKSLKRLKKTFQIIK